MVDAEKTKKVRELADRISKEKDPKKFSELVAELNDLLDDGNSSFKTPGEEAT